MRITKLAMLSAALLASAAAYAADDLAPAPSPYNWSGLRVGAGVGIGGYTQNEGVALSNDNVGGFLQVDDIDLYYLGLGVDAGGDGFLGTVEGGYDFQIGNAFVIGLQADYTRSNFDATAGLYTDYCVDGDCPDTTGTVSLDLSLQARESWSVLGRAGIITNPGSLYYGLGGFTRTYMDGELTLNGLIPNMAPSLGFDYHRDGWTAGAGIEALMSGATSLKLEYRRTAWDNSDDYSLDFLSPLVPTGTTLSTWDDVATHSIRAVVSYRFGGNNAEQQAAVDAIPAVDWTAFYVGASGGFSLARHNAGLEYYDYDSGIFQVGPDTYLTAIGGDFDFGGDGLVGRLEAGADLQVGQRFVVGALADYTFSNVETEIMGAADFCVEDPNNAPDDCDLGNTTIEGSATYTLKTGDSWSIGGRAGVLLNPQTLFYGLGAYTRTNMEGSLAFTINGDTEELGSYSYDRDGWTLGFGMETMVTDNLAAKLEYRNTKWTEDQIVFGDDMVGLSLSEDSNVQSFTTGLTWRFN